MVVKPCCLFNPPVCVLYIHVMGNQEFLDYSRRFVDSYLRNPPGMDHQTLIVCNGGPPDQDTKDLFSVMPHVRFFTHDNTGWDIGAYIAASRTCNADMVLYMCGTGYFARPGWLKRMVQVWDKFGPGFYGSIATYEVSPHINTSGFWCAPRMMADYPFPISNKHERYQFEHGPNAMWKLVMKSGLPTLLVTWDGEYNWPDWRKPENAYRKGTQANLLTRFRHTKNYEDAPPMVKEQLQFLADRLTDYNFLKENYHVHYAQPL